MMALLLTSAPSRSFRSHVRTNAMADGRITHFHIRNAIMALLLIIAPSMGFPLPPHSAGKMCWFCGRWAQCSPVSGFSLSCQNSVVGATIDDALAPLDDTVLKSLTPRQKELFRRRRERSLDELEQLFEDRIAKVAPAMLEALNAGPGAMAVADNVLGPEHVAAMRREAIAVTERGLLRGSASAYSTAAPETFEERYGDEPGISASVLTPEIAAGELSPRCRAYLSAASRVLSRVLSGARRGALQHTETTDHQLRLTNVAQQVHMDNSFDGKNRRLLTTIYYLNPAWQTEHGGRFIPWPCSDVDVASRSRAAQLASTTLTFDDLPRDAQMQIPPNKRDSIRLRISRKLAPSADYEATMGLTRRAQAPVEPVGDRLIAFYADELLHSVEPVATAPLVREREKKNRDALRVHHSARFALSLWLPAPTKEAILPTNPAQEWLMQLRERAHTHTGPQGEATLDPIGGTLHIEEVDALQIEQADAFSSTGALQSAPAPANEQGGNGVQAAPQDKGISAAQSPGFGFKKGGGKNGSKGGGKRTPRQ